MWQDFQARADMHVSGRAAGMQKYISRIEGVNIKFNWMEMGSWSG
jgi:hypothetical protein